MGGTWLGTGVFNQECATLSRGAWLGAGHETSLGAEGCGH